MVVLYFILRTNQHFYHFILFFVVNVSLHRYVFVLYFETEFCKVHILLKLWYIILFSKKFRGKIQPLFVTALFIVCGDIFSDQCKWKLIKWRFASKYCCARFYDGVRLQIPRADLCCFSVRKLLSSTALLCLQRSVVVCTNRDIEHDRW